MPQGDQPTTKTNSSSSSSTSTSSLPATSTSATCPRCSAKLLLPPAIDLLTSVFPSIRAIPINRSSPRCRQCDKVNAERAAYFAKCPPPEHNDPIEELQGEIWRIEKLIAEGIRVKELGCALIEANRQKVEKEKERDDGVREGWEPFWGVWGLLDGQEEV